MSESKSRMKQEASMNYSRKMAHQDGFLGECLGQQETEGDEEEEAVW